MMRTYIGEFECKVDEKGRMKMPSELLKQFPANLRRRFVINKSVFQKCLVLNPMDAWTELEQQLSKLNPRFNKKHDDFIRQYTDGNTLMVMDSASRILIPRRLLDFARIKSDVTLIVSLNRIEIWSTNYYTGVMKSYDAEKFAALAEEVMGSIYPDRNEK